MSRTLQDSKELSALDKRALLADLLREKAEKPRRVVASFAQQRLWFLDQMESGTGSYNVSRAARMKGRLNLPALRQTLNALVARHESLRTNFGTDAGEPVQIISPAREMEIPLIDLRGLRPEDRLNETRRRATLASKDPFNLVSDRLLRATLFQVGEQDHVLLLVMHHIISDGWSMGVLVREIGVLYEAFVNHQPSPLPPLSIQYSDFALWQRQWLQGDVLEEQLGYWTKQLAGAPAVLDLPTDRPRPAMQTFNGAYYSRGLPKRLGDSLNLLSRREGVTLFMTLLAAFQTLLYRYTNQDDIVIGTPIANRTHRETEDLIGFFVNTLVLRSDLSGNPTFRELLGRVKETSLGAYAHQDLPFEKLVEGLNPERSLSHSPLFQVMFALQNAPREAQDLKELTITRVPLESGTSKFELTFFITETANELSCYLEYNTDLFDEITIARMLNHFEVLLEGIVADQNQRLAKLLLLTETERQQLLSEWNDTRVEFPSEDCLHQLFEAQAEKTPEAIALVCGDERLTYSELNTRANQLAHHLQRLGIGPEDRVGVCLRRTPSMLIAILGTLKAGAAYTPLDPAYPQHRLGFILQDAGAAVLLTQNELVPMLPQTDSRVVCVDSDWQVIAREDQSNPVSTVTPQNIGCVIYTSGSTGVPKGVSIQHCSTVMFLHWAIASFDKQDLAAVLASTSICFDLSVFEMFAPLCSGGKVVLVENALHLPDLAAADVTLVNTVPSAMTELVRLRAIPPSVRTINLAGEPLMNSLVQDIYQQGSVKQVLNLYGPSEDTTYSTFAQATKGAKEEPSIGRPIANTEVYLLDRFSQLVPVGVPGELHLGGAGLARGYLNRASLTAEKFVPNPFSREPGARLYKTGDLARYQSDGTIQFLGRIDHQVKLRGYRIELGEIETTLREHAAVQDSVVMVRDLAEGDKTLVGYIVVDSNDSALQEDKLAAELKSFLKKKLPDYMVPAYFVELDQLPLTPNGKIDRKALLKARPRLPDSSTISRPRNEIEFALTLIWERVLDVRPIGLEDNFFELGGHSLLAVRLMAEIEKEFGQRIPLVSLFQSATIEGLAAILQQGVNSISWPIVVELQRGGSKPPLFCVSHPGVNALGYRSLAQYLEPDQPVYGLQAQYPEDLQGEHSNKAVDELATEYLEAIRAVQQHGPYQLAGMCRGAHIAFEMARRLENQGESVTLVGIFDTWVIENTYNRLLFLGEYYFDRLASLLRLGLRDQLDFIKGKERTANGNAGDDAPEASENAAAKQKNPYEVYFPGPDFAPKTYPGRITVFRTKRQPLNRIRDAQLGWGRLADGVVDVHVIPGKHGNLLREPNVQGLAEELKKCLLEKSG